VISVISRDEAGPLLADLSISQHTLQVWVQALDPNLASPVRVLDE